MKGTGTLLQFSTRCVVSGLSLIVNLFFVKLLWLSVVSNRSGDLSAGSRDDGEIGYRNELSGNTEVKKIQVQTSLAEKAVADLGGSSLPLQTRCCISWAWCAAGTA